MIDVNAMYQPTMWMMSIFFLFMVWDLIWKGLGLWYAGKYQQKGWFIAILIINTVGVLPIIYLLWFKPKTIGSSEVKNVSVKAPVKKRKKR
ncbi:MAG: DUF5652 family protein [Candidatus Woesearchaeota archaeon]|jgi:hypothetical protein